MKYLNISREITTMTVLVRNDYNCIIYEREHFAPFVGLILKTVYSIYNGLFHTHRCVSGARKVPPYSEPNPCRDVIRVISSESRWEDMRAADFSASELLFIRI